MKSRLALITLLTLAAAPALAHSPRGPSPIARLDALAMPGLAPARGLMDRPAPRAVLPEVTTRRSTPFLWGWFRAPVIVTRHDSPRCEVVYSPHAGRIETCTLAPRAPARRSLFPELDER